MIKEVRVSDLVVDKPGLQYVRMTSDIAKQWLLLNVRNRRIRRTLVEYLKRQISADEWQPDHPQPVVFSDAGRLIDGQHRLTAIAESDIGLRDGVSLRVETGARDSIREYMDTGIARTLDDRVELDADPALNKLASQLVLANMAVLTHDNTKYGKATPDDAKEFFSVHEKAIRFVYEVHRRERGVGQTTVAVAAMHYFERNEEKAYEFYTDLFVSAGNIQQAQMLRDYLLRVGASGSSVAKRDIYFKAVGCMKAHMQGRKVAKVTRASAW